VPALQADASEITGCGGEVGDTPTLAAVVVEGLIEIGTELAHVMGHGLVLV
jgi:hypothetical protein